VRLRCCSPDSDPSTSRGPRALVGRAGRARHAGRDVEALGTAWKWACGHAATTGVDSESGHAESRHAESGHARGAPIHRRRPRSPGRSTHGRLLIASQPRAARGHLAPFQHEPQLTYSPADLVPSPELASGTGFRRSARKRVIGGVGTAVTANHRAPSLTLTRLFTGRHGHSKPRRLALRRHRVEAGRAGRGRLQRSDRSSS
jgi:hypothetical protein